MRNHERWFTFFAGSQDVDVRETDLMVVRGWTKAREWNLTASPAAFSPDIPPGGMSSQWAHRPMPYTKPSADSNQCVFMQYYIQVQEPAQGGQSAE
ncbi:hypothetical protein AcW1_006542 [Taiwanofungus camphoratus]|nr:hypothetical protein AcW1_006542 [Antrodia cinnamomea]